MLQRLECPELPARDILLRCTMVIRKSCGTNPLDPDSAQGTA
jgi:hypothetical protein